MLVFYAILALFGAAAGVPVEEEDAETLVRRVIGFQERQQELTREYAFRERISTTDVDSEGRLRKTESKTFLVTPSPGGEYRRLVARNGRPLPPKEEAKEEKKFREYLDEQMKRSAEARDEDTRKKIEERAKRFRERLQEALEVFDFERLPDAVWDGEPVRAFRFSPKPGYEGHSRATKILARMEGTVFIDTERSQLARIQVRFRDDLKFLGGLFGRVSEGSEALAEGYLVDDELWVVDRVEVSLDARFYFLKKYRQRISLDFHDYAKYTVSTEERVGGRSYR